MSDDGAHALTIIAFIGSVFSPYYAFARRRGRGDPENFCALNVALYGRGGKRWAMTERGAKALYRTQSELGIGPSRLLWNGDGLVIDIDEMTVPFFSRIRGRVRVLPQTLVPQPFALDRNGLHYWQPIAPVSRVEVELSEPGLSWSGSGYFDMNHGSVPLEESFAEWDWSRAGYGTGARVLYDVICRDGTNTNLALDIAGDGSVREMEAPPRATLPSTGVWRIKRATRSDDAAAARVVKTLEDTPFYARSLIETSLTGQRIGGVHESLSLDRFEMPIVQAMLPFRMPRRAG